MLGLSQHRLPRIYLLGTWVNKPTVYASNPSGWHHAHGVGGSKKTRVEEKSMPASPTSVPTSRTRRPMGTR
jgi:hypothetical protein